MLQAMVFTSQVLNELVKFNTPFNRNQLPVMMRFLLIAERILSWELLPARFTRRHCRRLSDPLSRGSRLVK